MSLEVLSEGSERGEDDDADLAEDDEFDNDYRRLPWGAARTPAAAAEVMARVLASDPEIRPTAQVLAAHPARNLAQSLAMAATDARPPSAPPA